MFDRCSFDFLKHCNYRNWNISQHEEREGEHGTNFRPSLRAELVPLNEDGNHPKHKHKQDVIRKTEHDGRQAGRDDHPSTKHTTDAKYDNHKIEKYRNHGDQKSRRDCHKHVIAREAVALRIREDVFDKLPAVFNEDLVKTSSSSKPLIP